MEVAGGNSGPWPIAESLGSPEQYLQPACGQETPLKPHSCPEATNKQMDKRD